MTLQFEKNAEVVVFGEAMIELSGLSENTANIGVAGDTYNTAVYLSRAGVKTSYVTGLGEDQFSGRIRKAIAAENIDTRFIRTIPDRIPGLYAINVDAHGERSFNYWRSESAARAFFSAQDIDDVLGEMAKASVFYLSGITLSLFQNNISDIIALVKNLTANGGILAFDTNYRANGWPSPEQAIASIEAIIPYVSVALPTWDDEAVLFGVSTPEECCERWLKNGAAEVAVKAGPKGAFLSGHGWVSPDVVVSPKDTTGAGDSFNGGYLSARIMGHAPSSAAEKANQLAARVLMRSGAILPK
jgi:2-dehydro-3-deoxygluconokinase